MCLLRLQRFAEAYQAIEDAFVKALSLTPRRRRNCSFGKGFAKSISNRRQAARKTLEEFLSQFPPGREGNGGYARQFPAVLRIAEARLLVGTCLLLEGKAGEAADYYAHIKASLASISRGRATVLQLHALLEAGRMMRR